MERIEVDTLDVFVVIVGLCCGFWIMSMPWVESMISYTSELEDYLLAGMVAALLFLKRVFLPTPSRREGVPPSVRMGYLFIAIVGALSACGALVGAWLARQSGEALDQIFVTLGIGGTGLLLVAVVIERHFIHQP